MKLLVPQTVNKRILIAVDHSENARRAVAHVAGMSCALSDFDMTLMHVLLPPEADYFGSEAKQKAWIEDERGKVHLMLDAARQFLAQSGYDAERIRQTVFDQPVPSISRALLAEMDAGAYGIVVLGRQGMTPKEEFLLGSVSKEVLSKARDCAVWIVT